MSDRLLLAFYAAAALLTVLALTGFFMLDGAAGDRLWRAARFPVRALYRAAAATLARLGVHLTWRYVAAFVLGLAAFAWLYRVRPWPAPGANAVLDYIAVADPAAFALIRIWYLAVPGLATFGGFLAATGAWRVWAEGRGPAGKARGELPPWPDGDLNGPSVTVGELHHPTEERESEDPDWLTLPERGLYTGMIIVGAVGTGKTSACMHPFARQILSWNAGDPSRRAAGLTLEVKGDFCHDIRRILKEAGRESDYIELGLGGQWQWNPLDSDMDSYSLAYTVAALLNQLFGRGKDPFWQQAATNLVRWIIELHRSLPANWVTLRDVYRCAIEPDLFAARIEEARDFAGIPEEGNTNELLLLDRALFANHAAALGDIDWTPAGEHVVTPYTDAAADRLTQLSLPFRVSAPPAPTSEHAERVLAIQRWYDHDWKAIDVKLRTSIVEGVSVFLSMFDLPDVARVFCPPPPERPAGAASVEPISALRERAGSLPVLRRLPRLEDLIEDGKVIAFNMPAGANPALARAAGVLLKNAWLQALLKRPAAMKTNPNRYFRPAVFICDEYQAFATVGEDDPSGDEKSFALTRQCRCIPIVATQSISSLKSVLPGQDAWRALIQTLRTRIFLSLSDASSAQLASEMCGKVRRYSPSFSFSEQTKPGFSLVTGRAGGGKGSLGASKSYREVREPVFHPRAFTLLENCQAIALPYDGVKSLPATRVYLKPYYLPRDLPYWRAREGGRL